MKKKYLLILLFVFTTNSLYPQDLADTTYSTKSDSINKIDNSAPSKNARLNSRDQINKYDSCSIKPYDKSYVIRLGLNDEDQNIEFYGLSIAAIQNNFNSVFNGMTINAILGDPDFEMQFKSPESCINVNGINISLWSSSVKGTINGFTCGGLYIQKANNVNGIASAFLGTFTNSLNGVQFSIFANAVQTAHGVLIGGLNSNIPNSKENVRVQGIVFGLINWYGPLQGGRGLGAMIQGVALGLLNINANVKGLSFALINSGNCWLQIGLINGGDSIVQVGILNLDDNGKLGIPFINVNL